MVKSASFTMPVAKGLIKRVVAAEAPIASLFSQEQQLFLLGMAKRKVDYSKVIVLGPLRAHVWKFEDPACTWPITAELWRRDTRQQAKTRWALEYYAGQARRGTNRAPSRRAAGKRVATADKAVQ